ncbi:MAG: histidinol-phosphatase HisJ family protein [Clostridia bacterium]|nr:histidinol-phosphatase HisJ family protein [Clostridia bacterium]
MISEDFHVHSVFSDGQDTLRAIASAAYARGMTALGFSDHGYAPYDTDCCIRRDRIAAYREAVSALREEYRGRMAIYCGIEQEYGSDEPTAGFDYVIGSAHYLFLDGECLNVDWKRETLLRARELMGGDIYAVCEAYYCMASDVVEKTKCDVIGHFDLIAKLNGDGSLFDENHPRYVAAWQEAAERLLAYHIPFEVNTGAIARGHRTEAYPAPPILRWLIERDAKLILSSDAHKKENLMFDFSRQEDMVRALGGRLLTHTEWLKH